MDFAPVGEEEEALLKHLKSRWRHVSLERLLSGSGLFNLYSWLKDSGRYREPAYLSRMVREMDPAQAITRAARKRKNPLALKTLDLFASILGSASGNLALTGMATGGVYLGGGIPPGIIWALERGSFMKAFMNKGRFRGADERNSRSGHP